VTISGWSLLSSPNACLRIDKKKLTVNSSSIQRSSPRGGPAGRILRP
jgi:hypothetical protein